MSETKPMPKIPEGVFTEEQLAKINGGALLECSASEIDAIFAGLQSNYDNVVAFTSYVIETVASAASNLINSSTPNSNP